MSLLLLLLFAGMQMQAQTEPTWESLNQRGYPQWFSDAKLGIFIHWGVFSVPAYASKEGYGEWYYRGLSSDDASRQAFQKRVYGKNSTYRDFDSLFKAELWDPEEWATLFENAGARYVLLVTKHHDGYCLWPSKFAPNWNSVDGGPHRDIVGELTDVVRAHGMKMGFYYSLPEWTSPLHYWMKDPDDSIANYVDTHMIPQFKELVSKYKPTMIFADGEWNNSAEQWHSAELISWYYNTVGDDAIVNDRWGTGSDYGFKTPEYSAGIAVTNRPWAECRGIGRSFGLNRNEPLSNYLTSDELIRHFVTLVAAGGGMTLNVGPAADGQIPMLQQERLLDLGKWLKINGEAIYASRPYKKQFEMRPFSVSRTDSIINFDWVRNAPDPNITCDDFQACWKGYLLVTRNDDYVFEMQVVDDAKVIIDGKTVIDITYGNKNATQSNAQALPEQKINVVTIKLKEGLHPVEIRYDERDMEASIRLYWSSKHMERQIVNGFYADEQMTRKGLAATYTCLKPWLCYTQSDSALYALALDYPEDSLVLAIDKPADDMVVTMLGCDKVLPWRYDDGKLIVDTKSLKYHDLTSTAVWTFKMSPKP